MNKPVWIVFEGIDGSGKTTQAKLLNEYLNGSGVKSRYRHVFDSGAGRLLREVFLGNAFSNTVEILLLCAARQAFLDEVAVEEECDVMIVDRFFLSILAMQGNDDDDIEVINYLRNSICHGRDREIVFYLNTPPEDCRNRLGGRGARDRIEEKDVDFHGMVSERYLTLLGDEESVHQFDGSGEVQTIHRAVIAKALHLLELPGVTG